MRWIGTAGMRRMPEIRKRRGPSLVWLIPLVTLIAGGLAISKYLAERGPEITITFKTANGIKKKTPIKYKDVQIGTVKSIRFSNDFSHVVLTARMAASARPFLREGTRFWVVRPRLSVNGISGLQTLLSGTYIEVDPGKGPERRYFVGLDDAPSLTSDLNGLHVTLVADRLGSLDIGSPVYFKGVPVGKVVDYELDKSREHVLVHAFVRKPYDALVRDGSHFWNISGIDATMGVDGLRLRSPSLLTMMLGGIAFDSPGGEARDGQAVGRKRFRLYAHYDDVVRDLRRQSARFVSFFDGSVHGLDVGAPVEFRGVRVGRVTEIGMRYDAAGQRYLIPVTFEIDVARMPGVDDGAALGERMRRLVEQGLRAQLRNASLISGKLYIDLGMHQDSVAHFVAGKDAVWPEIPTVPGGWQQLQASAQQVLRKLAGVDTKRLSAELGASLHALREMLERLNEGRPDEVLAQAKRTLKYLEQVLDPAQPTQYRINEASRELSDMARAIRTFVDMLERHPEAVLLGKPDSGE